MKLIKKIIVVAAVMAVSTFHTHATIIDLGVRSWDDSSLGNLASEANKIEQDQGLNFDLQGLQKFEYPGRNSSGGWTTSLQVFSVNPNTGEPDTATVTWNIAGSGSQISYILAKDGVDNTVSGGNKPTLYHLYQLTGADMLAGSTTVTINGTKALSHISFFGTTSVPDGGTTMAMLGAALIGLGLFRRRIA